MSKLVVGVATVTGTARDVANELISTANHAVEASDAESILSSWCESDDNILLLVCATTGSGDIPAPLDSFHRQLTNEFPRIGGKHFAIVALGDSSYTTFAEAGDKLQYALEDIGAVAIAPRLTLDATEHFEPCSVALEWFKRELPSHAS